MKLIHPIFIYCAVFAWLNLAWITPQRLKNGKTNTAHKLSVADSLQKQNSLLYQLFDLEPLGLSRKAFDYAIKGYRLLSEKHLLANPGFLTICDFSQSSRNKRMYLLDMTELKVILTTFVGPWPVTRAGEYAHEILETGPNRCRAVSVSIQHPGLITAKHGLSLRMQGLEKGYNDKALARNIVVHGAQYLGEKWLNQSDCMGRSFGCPAIPQEQSAQIIDIIKDGTCLFIYHPTTNYLQRSKILND